MVYAPQRRHVVAQVCVGWSLPCLLFAWQRAATHGLLSTTMQALSFMQHLYTPNTLILIFRLLAQIQIRAPAIIQPTRSLFALFTLVTGMNAVAVLFHYLDFSTGQNGTKGIFLDFVGQAEPASFTRIILLDLLIYLIQLITVAVAYVVNFTPTLPKQELFPYDDLLLPADAPPSIAEGDLDVESGDQFRQRRMGKGPRYQNVATDDTEVWLDEEDEEPDATLGKRVFHAGSRMRDPRHGAPLIFNLSLSYLFKLITRLRAPKPPGLTTGGTPSTSPPVTPREAHSRLQALAATLAQAQERIDPSENTSAQRLAALTALVRDREGAAAARVREQEAGGSDSGSGSSTTSDGDAEEGRRSDEEQYRRIPGDYWTSRP